MSIIKGVFALVGSGNCTCSFLLDGPDVQARADAALGPHWGDSAMVFERGIPGYALSWPNKKGPYFDIVYKTRDAAEQAMAERGA